MFHFLKGVLAEQKRLLTIRPRAPLRVLGRVARWWTRVVLREGAPQLFALAAIVCIVLVIAGAAGSTLGAVALALIALAGVWELRMAWLAHRSSQVVEAALEGLEARKVRGVPRSHLVVPPLMFGARSVERKRGVPFAELDDGSKLRLDIYRSAKREGEVTADEPHAPAVIQVHGGGWLAGSRYEQGIPLLNHLASLGWVGFNIDYRLSPQAVWPAHIIDVKRAIAWVRENHERLGIDPNMICITGGSAGGHLTALAGLTQNDPAFQPGFEEADTSLAAAVPFYGVYDFTDEGNFYWPGFRDWVFEKVVIQQRFEDAKDVYAAASPTQRVHEAAPPFMVLHGEVDTLVPVGDARLFVERLRAVSRNPVRYVELPDAEHAFDLWPSERTARVAEGIGRFLTAVANERQPSAGASTPAAKSEPVAATG